MLVRTPKSNSGFTANKENPNSYSLILASSVSILDNKNFSEIDGIWILFT